MRKGDCRDLSNSDKDRKEISASRESLSPKFLCSAYWTICNSHRAGSSELLETPLRLEVFYNLSS